MGDGEVGLGHEPQCRFDAALQVEQIHPFGERGGGSASRLLQGAERSSGDDPIPVLLDHREYPACQVAEPVGQLRIVQLGEPLPGEVAVGLPGDLAHEVEAEGVGAEAIDRLAQFELDPGTLGEALPAEVDESVGPDPFRQGESGRLEHRRPDDAVEAGDVLANDMQLGRPLRL